jgi:hypothetical protein
LAGRIEASGLRPYFRDDLLRGIGAQAGRLSPPGYGFPVFPQRLRYAWASVSSCWSTLLATTPGAPVRVFRVLVCVNIYRRWKEITLAGTSQNRAPVRSAVSPIDELCHQQKSVDAPTWKQLFRAGGFQTVEERQLDFAKAAIDILK